MSPADARLVLAREHGFESWAAVPPPRAGPARERRAVPAGVPRHPGARSHGALSDLLDRYPGLVSARGTNGNDLLGLAASIACGRRDKSLVSELLARGADPSGANDRGWTPLHQAGYGNDLALARLLLDAGARTDLCGARRGRHAAGRRALLGSRDDRRLPGRARGHAGQPAHRRRAGPPRPDPRVRPARRWAERAARAQARGFYRPHTGFPPWQPSDDPQEILDEALVWAAKSDRADVLGRLVELGADVDADPYRGTALTWAAVNGHVAAVGRLIELGADVNRKATFGGPDHGRGVTAHPSRRAERTDGGGAGAVAAGADPAIQRTTIYGRPRRAGWAAQGGHHIDRRVPRGPVTCPSLCIADRPAPPTACSSGRRRAGPAGRRLRLPRRSPTAATRAASSARPGCFGEGREAGSCWPATA